MKYFRFHLLVILLVCYAGSMVAQSRITNDYKLTILAQSEKLRNAMGWRQDISGNWIPNENAIADSKLEAQSKGSVPQNFIWMQFISLKSGDRNFYALVYENNAYVSNAYTERRVCFYIMTERSYASLVNNIKKKNAETLTITSPSFGYMSDNDSGFGPEKLLKLMAESLAKDSNGQQQDFSINAQNVDNEDVVRFRLPELASIMSGNLKGAYFETAWNNFEKILIPLSEKIKSSEFDFGNMIQRTEQKQAVSESENPLTTATKVVSGIVDDGITDRNASVSNQTDFDSEYIEGQPFDSIGYSSDTVSYIRISDRQNRERATVSKPVAVFGNIQGWYYSSEGDWVDDKSYLYDFETVGRYEMRYLSYKQKSYILIVRYEKYAGQSFYLIAKDDYLKVISQLETSSILRLPVLAYAGIGYRLEDIVEQSEEIIDTPEKEDMIVFKQNYLILQYRLSQPKNIARFFIFFQECSSYGSQSTESCNIKVSNKVRYDDESLLLTDAMFNKMYYESSYTSFVNFFRKPLSPVTLPKVEVSDGIVPR